MRGYLMAFWLWGLMAELLAAGAWGGVTELQQPQTSGPTIPVTAAGAPEVKGLSPVGVALFSKQTDLYEEEEATTVLTTDSQPSWLELYLALGGIILVALGIVRLAEIRRVDDPCFIATAAWGTPLAWEVSLLRGWRDKYLLTSVAGVAFVDIYYRVSPTVAEYVARSPFLAAVVRLALLPVVLISDGILFTAVAVPIFLATFSGITLIAWFRRRNRHSVPPA